MSPPIFRLLQFSSAQVLICYSYNARCPMTIKSCWLGGWVVFGIAFWPSASDSYVNCGQIWILLSFQFSYVGQLQFLFANVSCFDIVKLGVLCAYREVCACRCVGVPSLAFLLVLLLWQCLCLAHSSILCRFLFPILWISITLED